MKPFKHLKETPSLEEIIGTIFVVVLVIGFGFYTASRPGVFEVTGKAGETGQFYFKNDILYQKIAGEEEMVLIQGHPVKKQADLVNDIISGKVGQILYIEAFGGAITELGKIDEFGQIIIKPDTTTIPEKELALIRPLEDGLVQGDIANSY
ncbi:hypothetical protein HYV84_06305, partial [Candidatus Woesearchaeota archaeon]|nr:hypothetical protein [Candidatus Woesearchaeota archaeon]